MIKPLRKKHLQIWLTLLVLIPAGIIVAWISVKKTEYNTLLQPVSGLPLPKIIASLDKENYTVRLRGTDSIAEQLEWINKSVLTVPSAVIYRIKKQDSEVFDPGQAGLVGRIEARGRYYFPLSRDSLHENSKFVLYDFIHDMIIDSIGF